MEAVETSFCFWNVLGSHRVVNSALRALLVLTGVRAFSSSSIATSL